MSTGSVRDCEDLAYLWDQYKYRHELCWSAVYKVTIAVLGLAVVPYANDSLTEFAKYGMLVPPVLGTAFAAFGVGLVKNELDIFGEVKLAFHTLQNTFLEARIPDADTRRAVTHDITPRSVRKTRFDTYVWAFMIGLVTASFANTVFVLTVWIPTVLSSVAH